MTTVHGDFSLAQECLETGRCPAKTPITNNARDVKDMSVETKVKAVNRVKGTGMNETVARTITP